METKENSLAESFSRAYFDLPHISVFARGGGKKIIAELNHFAGNNSGGGRLPIIGESFITQATVEFYCSFFSGNTCAGH